MQEEATARPIPRIRFALLVLLGFGMLFALLFAPARRLDWVAGWLYLGLVLASWTAALTTMWVRNPELIRRRMSAGKGTKWWDRILLALLQLSALGMLIVASLDAGRFRWSNMSLWLWPAGAVLHLIGIGIAVWAMGANPHFESTVRIQTDRDHAVIDTGPYRYVRHPGYVGFLLYLLAAPLLLGSWWACLPAASCALVILVRTVLEDRTLRRELDGYVPYAQRVRYRVLPGVW